MSSSNFFVGLQTLENKLNTFGYVSDNTHYNPGNLNVSGNAVIGGDLSVTGNTTLSNVTISGTLMSSSATFANITVTNDATVSGNTSLSNTTITNANITNAIVTGGIITSGIAVSGPTLINNMQSNNINVGSSAPPESASTYSISMSSNNVITYTDSPTDINIWTTKVPIYVVKNSSGSININVIINESEDSVSIDPGQTKIFLLGPSSYAIIV